MTPNGFAYLALALWPIVTILIFMRFPPGRAVIISLLAGYLLLPPPPAQFDLPLVPMLNKESIASLCTLITAFMIHGRHIRLLPDNLIAKGLLIALVLSPVLTALTNGDAVINGAFYIQPLGLKEGVSMALNNAIMVIPFILAYNFLSTAKDQRDILIAFLVGGLAYSLPMLLEVRLSPQMNTWVYGYFQHSFDQMMRGGGFRPIVFLQHGLWVAFFAMMSVLAAFTLFKTDRTRDPKTYLMAGAYLLVVLVLCKSLGALIFALALIPVILFFSIKTQVRLALVLMLISLTYPVLKGNDLLPQAAILEQAYSISPERGQSLEFRLVNEALLLDRAQHKPVFGWGTFGRSLVHDQTGRLLTIPDGRWVIVFGAFGWVGYIAEFGLLALSGFLLWRRAIVSQTTVKVAPWMGGLVLILGINMIDMLPNATLTPLTWMISGAVMGYAMSFQKVRRSRPRLQSAL